jgi:hypothetical protein
MMAKRKRALGGGRKRLGPSVAQNLTIRIDDDLRGQLEAATAKRAEWKRRWNLSQEILLRLRHSFDKEREHRRNRAMRAICDLISDLGKRELHTDLQQSWHRDPYTFRAFKVAVTKILDGLEPVGEMRPPRTLAAVFEGRRGVEVHVAGPGDVRIAPGPYRETPPEELGEHAAWKALTALRLANPLTKDEFSAYFRSGVVNMDTGEEIPETDLTRDEFEELMLSWPRIRRALGIEEPREDTQ